MSAFDEKLAIGLTHESVTTDAMEVLQATSLSALRKHEATVSALGAELVGNSIVYVGALYYTALAALQRSSEPLQNGASDFAASAATLMVILPLLYEKEQERHEFLKLQRLERILESHDKRHPDMPLTPTIRRFVMNELRLLPKEPLGDMSERDKETAAHIIHQAHDRLHPNDPHMPQERFKLSSLIHTGKYVFEDLAHFFSPKERFRNVRSLVHTFGVCAAHLALKPFKEFYEYELEKNHPDLHRQIMDERIRNLVPRDKRAVSLDYDEELDRFIANPEHIQDEIHRQTRKMDNRSLRSFFSVSMMGGASAFLAVEAAHLGEMAQSFAQASSPADFATQSAVMLGYAFTTVCSVLPFQKGANSLAEHTIRIEARKNVIKTLKHLQSRLEPYSPETSQV